MQNWMRALAEHYEDMQGRYPHEDLLILFDIDGTILDIRYTVLYLLQAYDQHHNTGFFINRSINDINFTIDEPEAGLAGLGVDGSHFTAIRKWCEKYRWSMSAILKSHRPFPGILDVIRWFQMQPHTHVGLNSARANDLREETLFSLNRLGLEYRVQFSSELLYMREATGDQDISEAKISGIEYFRELGYRPFAMVDSQPRNLKAVQSCDPAGEILLLHLGTMCQPCPETAPGTAVHGNVYDLTELIPKKALPKHIQFVWRDVNNEAAFSEFIRSSIHWADVSALTNLYVSRGQLNRRNYRSRGQQDEILYHWLQQLREQGRGIRLDLKAGAELNKYLVGMLQAAGFDAENLWFHADLASVKEHEFRRLAETHAGAIIEVSIDFLAPLMLGNGQLAESVLDRFAEWGINRFALSWNTPQVRMLLYLLDRWGFEATIYDVRELQDFLQAALLTPRAMCSDFGITEWRYQASDGYSTNDFARAAIKLV